MANFGPSDIVKGIELALKIYRLGFVEENRADTRYQGFHDDINEFQSLLGKLNSSLLKAQRRYRFRGPTLGPHPYDPLSEEFEKERKAIVGPFLSTLKECQKLLDANKDYRAAAGRRTGPIQNLQWHLSQQQDRVDGLRRKLQFHSEKIRFVIDRLSLDLLTDLDAKVDDILAVAERNLEVSDDILLELNRLRSSLFGFLSGHGSLQDPSRENPHVASDAVAARFHENLLVDAPRDGNGENGIPLVEGFDALLWHFQMSASRSDQAPEHYLTLLKIRWLLAQIKTGRDYRDARPGRYYRRAVNQVEGAILSKIRKATDIVSYDDKTLLDLSDAHFRIWPLPASVPIASNGQLDQLVARANEEQVARIELAPDPSPKSAFVTIFRKSRSQFRLVRELSPSPDRMIITSLQVDTSQYSMIPRYALPTLETPCFEVAMFSGDEENLFTFSSMADLWKFQAVFLGYEVSFDHVKKDIQCQFSEDVKALDCLARIQIWQEPIILKSPTESLGDSSLSSSASVSGGSHGRQGSLTPSIAPPVNISRSPDGWQAEPLKASVIALYTQLSAKQGGKFAIISLELLEGVYVRPHECSCHVDYDKCSKLVLAGLNKRKLPLRVHYSGADAEGQPDPNTFDLFAFRLPLSSGSSSTNRHTEYLVLKFKTLEEKRHVHQELELRFKIRDKQIADRRNFVRELQQRKDHPERQDRINVKDPAYSPTSPMTTAPLSPAPKLELPDTGPALADVLATSPETRQTQRQSDQSLFKPTTPSTASSIERSLKATMTVSSSQSGSTAKSSRMFSQRPTVASSQTSSRRFGLQMPWSKNSHSSQPYKT